MEHDDDKVTFSRKANGQPDFDSRKLSRLIEMCRAAKTGTLSYADPALIRAAGQELWERVRLRMASTSMAVDEAVIFEARLEPGLLHLSQMQGCASSRSMLAVLEDDSHEG